MSSVRVVVSVVGALGALFMSSGCSQADPSDGIGDPGIGSASGPLYPFVDGARWTYEHSGGGKDTWLEEVALDASTYDGRAVMLLTDSPGPSMTQTRSYLEQSGTEVRRFHKEVLLNGMEDSVVDYDPGFTRFDEAWATIAAGTVDTRMYTRTEVSPVNGTLVDMRVQQYTIENTNLDIAVPAGNFSGCLQLFRARQAPDGGPPTGNQIREKRFTFCPGVGKVQEENLTDGGLEILVSCMVPGGNC